jgi:hypothetical protein
MEPGCWLLHYHGMYGPPPFGHPTPLKLLINAVRSLLPLDAAATVRQSRNTNPVESVHQGASSRRPLRISSAARRGNLPDEAADLHGVPQRADHGDAGPRVLHRVRVLASTWEPPLEWLGFLSLWAGLDVAQYRAKRATQHPPP